MSKPVTPVRRSRSGRPHAAKDDQAVTVSMELLPPEAASSPAVSATFFPSSDVCVRGTQDLMAMGAPASLHSSSRPSSMRRTNSAQQHHRGGQLTSTRPADAGSLQGQPVGALLLQLPVSTADDEYSSLKCGAPSLSVGLPQDGRNGHVLQLQTSFQHNTSKRYSGNLTSGGGTTVELPSCGETSSPHVSGAQRQQHQHSRPGSTGSTSSSMLMGGIPGPLAATTPGALSRLWTPESCLEGVDDSANTRAQTSATTGLGLEGITQSSAAAVPAQVGADHDVMDTPAQEPNHAEFYEYLHSRRTTAEGACDAHAFTCPNYTDLAASAVSTDRLGQHHLDDNDLEDVASQAPGTPHSVASGVMRRSNVFFTALRHSVGGSLMDEASMLTDRSFAPTEACSTISRANPMQEPSIALTQQPSEDTAVVPQFSAQASDLHGNHGSDDDDDVDSTSNSNAQEGAADEDEYCAAYVGGGEESKSVWDNPVQTPRDTTAAPTAEPSRASFLSLLRDLYDDSAEQGPASAAGDDESQQGTFADVLSSAQEGGDEGADMESLRSSMTTVQQTEEQQTIRRQELNDYITGLQSKVCEDGQLLVELPRNYQVLVQQLLLSKRAEYSSLAGWLGPRRYQDLPINNLPDAHDDLKVAEGLSRIKALDAKLAEQEVALLILARERDPEAWAAQEHARLQHQAAAVEAALKRERMKHMRKAQLCRALDVADQNSTENGSGMAARASSALSMTSSVRTAAGGHRLPALRSDEEALVEAVLKRSDQEEDANPFDLTGSACMPPDPADCIVTRHGMSRPASAISGRSPTAGAAGEQQLGTVQEGMPGQPVGLLSREGSVLVAPLGLSSGALQGEASAAALLRKAHELAMELARQPRDPTPETSQQGDGQGDGEVAGQEGLHASVDLAAGLAVHTRALLRAQQAAVAGMSLAAIDTHLERFAQEHTWSVDGALADFSSLDTGAVTPRLQAARSIDQRSGSGASCQQDGRQDAKTCVLNAQQPAVTTRAVSGKPPGIPTRKQSTHAAAARQQAQASPAPPQAAGSIASSIGTAGNKRDYLREEREAKELAQREADLDSRIRAFKTSDPAGKPLSAIQLAALVSECREVLHRAAAISIQASQGTSQQAQLKHVSD